MEQVIAHLVAQGLRISLIKHAHHQFDIDTPGKDSWRHRRAGAHEVLVASDQRWALMHEHRGAEESSLKFLLSKLAPCDLVLVEGYKYADIPKVEVWRRDAEKPRLDETVSGLIAHICDEASAGALPALDINDAEAVTTFIMDYFKLQPVTPPKGARIITVRYFAGLREALQRDGETLALSHEVTLSDLLITLRQRSEMWAKALQPSDALKVAVNQEVTVLTTPLRHGDEVALFPPVTGG